MSRNRFNLLLGKAISVKGLRHKKKNLGNAALLVARSVADLSTRKVTGIATETTAGLAKKYKEGSLRRDNIIKNKEGIFDTVRPLKSKMFIKFLSNESSKKQLFNAIDSIRGKEKNGTRIVEIDGKRFVLGKIGAVRSESTE
jgi:hypothetical protein